MKTLTVSKARQGLGGWLARALAGEDIGIIAGDRVVALRPVGVHSDDWALSEYALTERELDRAARNIERKARHEHRTGKTKAWDGTAGGLRG
jgi:antitoxin (DNA-binding transcriptional repressor) of toxin-antitoxin stability system